MKTSVVDNPAQPRQAPVATARGSGKAGSAELTVQIVRADELSVRRDAWQRLADAALEPNCFYEPWMLLPALERLGAPALSFALIKNPAGELHGFFPLETRRRLRGLPVRVIGLWKHLHCFLSTPLVHRDHAAPALRAFFRWARTQASVVELESIHGDGPFAQVLIDVIDELRLLTFPVESFNRALLIPGVDADAYVRASGLSASHRRELSRLRRRLGDLGRLETRLLQPSDAAAPWIADFLQLEASGWKGQEATALGAAPAERAFFADAATAAHAAGKLLMLGLFLDGRPIALKCNFLAGRGAFAFKIAYDERYEKYSPGVQLELDNLAEVHARPGLAWMDSCAKAGHFMINRLWKERRTIQHLVLSTGTWRGNLLTGVLPLLRAVKRCWRSPI